MMCTGLCHRTWDTCHLPPCQMEASNHVDTALPECCCWYHGTAHALSALGDAFPSSMI